MVDTYTQGKLGLIEPSRGAYVDTWDEPLYANWQTLEAAISGTTTINLTSSNVVLTVPTFPAYPDPPTVSTSAQNLRLLLTGAPSVNLTVYIPQTISGFWILDDQTTGSTTITIKTTASGSVGIASSRNNTLFIYCDGTNVKLADSGNNPTDQSFLMPTGTILSYGATTAPIGYLLCDGTAISRSTYVRLFNIIGTQWGAGDGSTTFNVPNLSNMFLRGSGTSSVGTYEADDFKSHTHTDSGHTHNYTQYSTINSAAGSNAGYVDYRYTETRATTTGKANIQPTGGSETRPVNKRVLYIIKT